MKCYECGKNRKDSELAFVLCKKCQSKFNKPIKSYVIATMVFICIGIGLTFFPDKTIHTLLFIAIGILIGLSLRSGEIRDGAP